MHRRGGTAGFLRQAPALFELQIGDRGQSWFLVSPLAPSLTPALGDKPALRVNKS
jgi:hypothetical protein